MKYISEKEKAKELVDKFTMIGLQQRNEGIACALIAVEEILKEEYCIYKTKYWEEVKSEIEKLS